MSAALLLVMVPAWVGNAFGMLVVISAFVALLLLAAAAGARDGAEWYTRSWRPPALGGYQAASDPESGVMPGSVPAPRRPPPVLVPAHRERLTQLEQVAEAARFACDEYDDVLELLEEVAGPGALDLAMCQLGVALDRLEELDRAG